MVGASSDDILQLPNETIKKTLEDIIKKNGFVKYKIELSPGSKKGDNYLGIVYRVNVTGCKGNGEKGILNLFCKVPVEGENMRTEFGLREAFLREIYVYDQILKDMKQLEAEKGIKDGFTSYAECLATNSTNLEEFLIMEDLSKKSYCMFDRMSKLDLDHTLLVMKALGKYHAHSFAMRDQKPELFKKHAKNIPEIFLKETLTATIQSFIDNFLKSAFDKLEFNGIYKEKWEDFHRNYLKYARECVDGSLADPYAVFCHGDCWNNNVMFQYKNGKPEQICLLDWQICRYSSPVLDLVYYIFNCTEKSLRDAHYQTLLKAYHDSFSSFLKKLGSNPDKLFPFSALQNQFKKFGKFGLAMGLLVIPTIMTSSEDAKPLDQMLENVENVTDNDKTVAFWKQRLFDVVTDMVDLGYM